MPLHVDDYRPTVELFGVSGSTGLWDEPASKWGDPLTRWDDPATAYAWRDAACQITAFTSTWGADQATGVLAQSAAGVLVLNTYDPDRVLDPSNPVSPLAKARAIGNPVRLKVPPSLVLGYGYVDELSYQFSSRTGQLTAADDIATLAQAETAADFWQPSNGLRAFAVAAIASAGQSVPVGPAPAAGDPVIAYTDTRSKAVWALLRDAALDGLCFAWIDRQTATPTLRLNPFGYPIDRGLRLGDGGIAMGELIAGGGASGVANVVDDATGELARTPYAAAGRDQQFEVGRIEPAGRNWANAILADRSAATVALQPGEVYPASMAELVALGNAQALDLVRVVLTAQGVDATLRLTGATFEGEAGGLYRAKLAAYGPGAPWAYLPPKPADPAATPSSRVATASKDAGIWTSGTLQPGVNRNKGNGLGPIRLGRDFTVSGTYAALLAFDGLDLGGVRRIRKIELVFVFDRAVPASPVDVEIQRVAATWDEGRVKSTDTSTAQNGNAVVWPGPAVTGPIVLATLNATAAGAEQRVDITSIALAHMPIALGGRDYPNFGYRATGYLNPPSGNFNLWLAATETDDDEPTATGCRLELTVEV